MLFVNAFCRADSPPVSIASITKNPVVQGCLGLVRYFPKCAAFIGKKAAFLVKRHKNSQKKTNNVEISVIRSLQLSIMCSLNQQ